LSHETFGFFGLVALAPLAAIAADHMNLEEGLPTRVEDAYPTAFRNREVQGVFSYDRTRQDENRVTLEPRLEFGISPNTELRIRAPFYTGNADRTGSGNLDVSALYNFNAEGLVLPALAVEGEGEIPTGKDSRGFDTTLKFIATKSISQTGLDRIHLNLGWTHNAGREADEREHRYLAILGYSRRLTADTVLVADFIREQERKRGENSNVIELGIRWQLTPRAVISFGAGAGIGEESPRARATIGFQRSL
jgi:Putative MetA-pathway of phenol degradation